MKQYITIPGHVSCEKQLQPSFPVSSQDNSLWSDCHWMLSLQSISAAGEGLLSSIAHSFSGNEAMGNLQVVMAVN